MNAIFKIKKKVKSIPVKKYCAKGYRKICCRRGYGVHSPFVYKFITKVIEERYAYYRYNDIEDADFAFKSDTKKKSLPIKPIPLKLLKLLFRLANDISPVTVLECGTSYGLSSFAIACAAPKAAITIIEPNTYISLLAKDRGLSADIVNDSYKNAINKFLSGSALSPDMIYIRRQSGAEDYEEIYSALSCSLPEKAIIITDGIRISKLSYSAFCNFAAHKNIKVVMDLYDIGILILSPKLNKERYKESF